MASPPSVIVLIVSPNASNTMSVIRNDNGIAVSEIKVARTSIKKTSRTSATTMAASISALFRLPIDASMKVDCRNWTFVADMPAGSVFWIARKRGFDLTRSAPPYRRPAVSEPTG